MKSRKKLNSHQFKNEKSSAYQIDDQIEVFNQQSRL